MHYEQWREAEEVWKTDKKENLRSEANMMGNLRDHEIDEILEGEDIIRYSKAQRSQWFGCMQQITPEVMMRKMMQSGDDREPGVSR